MAEDANHKKPGVVLIHGTDWNGGDAGQVIGETQDIANAGFFAASVWYELAPNFFTAEGYIPGQPCHETDGTNPGERMKLEINDIKNYVKAMRADSRCNGWVAVVGGSPVRLTRLRSHWTRMRHPMAVGRTGAKRPR